MTKITKDKVFGKKNLRILMIASICFLSLCVVVLPVVVFKYSKEKLSVSVPEPEAITDPINSNLPTMPELPSIVWSNAEADLFYYAPVENSTDVYIAGVKEDSVFVTEYIILPSEIEGGSKIVGVLNNVFKNNAEIKGLVLPNTYTYIGENAFSNCLLLRHLVIGNTIEESADALESRDKMVVADCAFENCVNLETIEIGASVGSVGESFAGCSSLKEITLYSKDVYESVFINTSFGGAFEKCSKVKVYSNAYTGLNPFYSKYYTMTQSVVDGKTYAEFSLIKILYEIKLNANGGVLDVATIKYEPNSSKALPTPILKHYEFCGWYTTSDFLGEPLEMVSEDMKGCFEVYAKWEPTEYSIHYVIGSRATNVGNPETFNINSDDIIFKDAVRNGYLFGGWYKDSGYSNKVEKLSDLLGDEETSAVTIYAKFDAMFVGSGVITGLTNEAKAQNLKSITIPSDIDGTAVGVINGNAFSGLLVEELIIDASLTAIGEKAFKDCVNLKRVIFNAYSLTTIESEAFSGCTSLESINLENMSTLSSIGSNVFKNCTKLKSLSLKNSVALSSINYKTFSGCTSLVSVNLPGNIREISANAFSDCSKLSFVNFADLLNIVTIGSFAFENCEGLVSIEIPSSVVQIKEGAFKGCTGLKVVNFSKAISLTVLPNSLFEGCVSLQSVTLCGQLAKIGASAFKNCSSLSELNLPSTLAEIGVGVFVNSAVQEISFVDGDNWYLVDSVQDDVTGLIKLDLSQDALNATMLKTDYSTKILIKRNLDI